MTGRCQLCSQILAAPEPAELLLSDDAKTTIEFQALIAIMRIHMVQYHQDVLAQGLAPLINQYADSLIGKLLQSSDKRFSPTAEQQRCAAYWSLQGRWELTRPAPQNGAQPAPGTPFGRLG